MNEVTVWLLCLTSTLQSVCLVMPY